MLHRIRPTFEIVRSCYTLDGRGYTTGLPVAFVAFFSPSKNIQMNFKLIALCLFLFGTVAPSFSQKLSAEDTVTVQGVCDDCKRRIEEAAYGKGVKHVAWDKNTKILTVAYRTDKTSLLDIEKRVAKAGHATRHVPVDKSDYESLPMCCRYEHVHDH